MMTTPKVVVLGAGAMGGLFGGTLREGGLDVTLVDIDGEHVAAINRAGLRIRGYGGERVIRVQATTDVRSIVAADVVLVQCKAMDTGAAVSPARHLFERGHTVAVSFQNGLGNEEAIGAIVGAENVVGGLTAQGATREAPGVILNYGELPSYIGELAGGRSARVRRIAAAFTAAGLETRASADIRRDKWKKLLGNIGLSATSGATGLRTLDMIAIAELRATIHRAVDEAVAVARAAGIAIAEAEKHELLDQLTSAGKGTGAAKSSLRVDLEHGRPTEIDVIYGSVVALGRRHGVATPTLETLIGIVKGLESGGRGAASLDGTPH